MTIPTNNSDATRSVQVEDWCLLVRKTDADDWSQVCHSHDPKQCIQFAERWNEAGYQVRVLPTK